MPRDSVIRIHAQAPQKPAWGAPCNGCGVCCLAQPCPVGMVMSRRRHGACAVVRWDAAQLRYRCGAAQGRPVWMQRLILRWIAAGRGCDSDARLD
jgi:hypothetical protein